MPECKKSVKYIKLAICKKGEWNAGFLIKSLELALYK